MSVPNMDRFPFSYSDPNYVSPWAKDEMEAEREREMESEDTKDQECPPLQR